MKIENLKQRRKQTADHIPAKSLPEQDRFTRLRTERKHFADTIKMIGYRTAICLASLLREHLARFDDVRSLLRQIFNNDVDLHPDFAEHPYGSTPSSCPSCPRSRCREALLPT